MQHPKAVGAAAMLALYQAGYDVLMPFGENTRYDLVINDGEAFRDYNGEVNYFCVHCPDTGGVYLGSYALSAPPAEEPKSLVGARAPALRWVPDPLPRRLRVDRNQREDEERDADARPEMTEDRADRDDRGEEDRQREGDLGPRQHSLTVAGTAAALNPSASDRSVQTDARAKPARPDGRHRKRRLREELDETAGGQAPCASPAAKRCRSSSCRSRAPRPSARRTIPRGRAAVRPTRAARGPCRA
jgi:PD-(D/E)XK endonuclease